MKRIVLGLILGLLLVSCATQSNYKELLNTWIGSSEDRLVNSWGPPKGIYNKKDGGKILTFNRFGSVYIPGNSNTTYDNMGGSITTITSGTNIPVHCETNFHISPSGKIVHWQFSGNSCVSDYQKPVGTPPANIDTEQAKQLKSLLDAGIMSQKEFDEAKKAIK